MKVWEITITDKSGRKFEVIKVLAKDISEAIKRRRNGKTSILQHLKLLRLNFIAVLMWNEADLPKLRQPRGNR